MGILQSDCISAAKCGVSLINGCISLTKLCSMFLRESEMAAVDGCLAHFDYRLRAMRCSFVYLIMRSVAKVGDLIESHGMYANAADASDMLRIRYYRAVHNFYPGIPTREA